VRRRGGDGPVSHGLDRHARRHGPVPDPVAAAGAVEGYLEDFEIDLQEPSQITGPCGRCLSTGQHAVCNDTRRDPLYAPWREEARQRGYESSACFPLKVDGQIAGVLQSGDSAPAPRHRAR
jgi:GAF domain-containing protein